MDLAEHFSIHGRTALVTGGSRGIGRGIATTLAAAGATVIVTARSANGLEETKAEVEAAGGSAVAIPADLQDEAAPLRLFEAATASCGAIDILVNNAAADRWSMAGPAQLMAVEDFDATLVTNLRAPFLLTGLVARAMIEGGGGAIVHVTSLAGDVGAANLAAYSASKGALTRWAEATAAEWGQYGIRVNCLSPGFIQTEGARGSWGDPQRRARMEAATSLGRLGQPKDIGLATLFLVSDAAAFITGETLHVDGGLLVGMPRAVLAGAGPQPTR